MSHARNFTYMFISFISLRWNSRECSFQHSASHRAECLICSHKCLLWIISLILLLSLAVHTTLENHPTIVNGKTEYSLPFLANNRRRWRQRRDSISMNRTLMNILLAYKQGIITKARMQIMRKLLIKMHSNLHTYIHTPAHIHTFSFMADKRQSSVVVCMWVVTSLQQPFSSVT